MYFMQIYKKRFIITQNNPIVFFILTTSITFNRKYQYVLFRSDCSNVYYDSLLMGKSKRVSLLTARNISFAILLSMGIISLLIGFTGYYSYSFKYLITILFSYLFIR